MSKHGAGNSNHGMGPDSSWTVGVDVYLEDATSVPPKFNIQTCLPTKANGDIVFNNSGRHGFTLLYHLHDLTNSGYHFPGPPHVDDGLWSRQGAGCPPDNYGKQWSEFTSLRVTDGGMTLIIRNFNDTQTEFGYLLRVTKDDRTYLALDPGGDNNNGNYL